MGCLLWRGGINTVSTDRIRETVRNSFGAAIAGETNLADRAAWLLNTFVPGKTDAVSLADRLEHQMFDDLYTALGPGMKVNGAHGECIRIHLKEIGDTADEMMGLLMESIRVSPAGYDTVRSFYMKSGSFHAMRVLYTRYGDYLGDGEKQLMERMIRKDYPETRWKEWIDGGK